MKLEHFKRTGRVAGLLAAFAITAACTTTDVSYTSEYVATTGNMTPQNRALRSVPMPDQRISVAVYDFPDVTGQFREGENFQTLSRAVSQGGSQILIKALQDAGQRNWFTVLDRSNLDDLIRERQIVTEMRRLYLDETQIDPNALPPLYHAGIIIQGGIIGYDTNFATGGYGARYLGIGANTRWKLDIVTVSMRAVSSATGEVLASVVVRKPIASSSKQGSVFNYVSLDELLEIEVGSAMNEPKQVALEQAIEKAVMALIAEGADIGIWSFKSKTAGNDFVAGFKTQQYDGSVPASATNRAGPVTPNPTRIVATRPAARSERSIQPISSRQLKPATSRQTERKLPRADVGGTEVLG